LPTISSAEPRAKAALAASVGVGLGVLHELMESEVDDVVGPKGHHDPERSAVRHGHEDGSVTLGGRRVGVARPRARAADGSGEVELATYEHFASRDPLSRLVLEQMLAGVSTRRLRRTREPVGEQVTATERSVSMSSVSRAFIAKTAENLDALMARRLDDVAVLMIDGIDLKGRTNVVALGISTDGVKTPLGLWEGSSENAAVATSLLTDLVARGLDVEQGVLCVLDGSKALRKAVRDVLGTHTPVQCCVRHKECHEDGHVRGWAQPRGRSRLRGVPSCRRGSLESIGQLVEPAGAR
jgi:putative transposase